jgi:hypothetical protein
MHYNEGSGRNKRDEGRSSRRICVSSPRYVIYIFF